MNPMLEPEDADVVAAATGGDRDALTTIVDRHRAWIYNIALRMVRNPSDAEDATQEILLKVALGIGGFEGRGSFRAWLYRVAFNHLVNLKRGRATEPTGGFEDFAIGISNMPDLELGDMPVAEATLLVEEAKIGCMTGMLMCLSREQRLAYVLGALFQLPDTLAAEILEIQPATFRKRLQRGRADLHGFMDGQCGLINKDNPCRCARKTRGFVNAGYVDPDNLKFHRDRVASVGEVASRDASVVSETLAGSYPALFQEHPFTDPQKLKDRLARLLENTELRSLF